MSSAIERWNRVSETFIRKGFQRRIIDASIENSQVEGLKKVLGFTDLTLFGIGAIIGAGVFVLTGEATRNVAGPSIILSYIISSISAILLAMSYIEFAVDYPYVGGAFNYVRTVQGEFLAWQAGISLIMEYTLGTAAVAKGFSGYFASLCGLDTSTFVFESSIFRIDVLALVLVTVLALVIAFGTKESSSVNMLIAAMNVMVILFILGAAVSQADDSHFDPFFPDGVRGTFQAAGIVFFAYIGFDSLANMAAEVKNPTRDLPLSVVTSIVVCTVLYVLMGTALIGLQAYNEIDESAPFSEAFVSVGMRWAGRIVSLGAITGILTSVLTSLISQSRIFLALAGKGLLPQWMSVINEKRGSPRHALIVCWLISGTLALLFDIDVLSKLVSMGTLFVLTLVSLAAVQRMYTPQDSTVVVWSLYIRLILLIVLSIAEGASFALDTHPGVYLTFLCLSLLVMVSFYFLPVYYTPKNFTTPMKPLVPTLAVLCGIHLMFSLGWEAHVLFIVWQCFGFVFYISYGMYHTPEAAQPARKEAELTVQQLEQENMNLMMTQNEQTSHQSNIL
eukprot:g3699.t1